MNVKIQDLKDVTINGVKTFAPSRWDLIRKPFLSGPHFPWQ